MFHGIGPAVGANIDISSMICQDATKQRIIYEINGGLAPRLATVKGPEELVAVGHKYGVVGKREYPFNPICGNTRGLFLPSVAIVVGIIEPVVVFIENENTIILTNQKMIRADITQIIVQFPCRAFILRAMEAAIAPVAKNAAVGGDTKKIAFHSDGFPNILRHAAKGEACQNRYS